MKKFCIITNTSKDSDFAVTNKIESLISLYGGKCTVLGDPLNNILNSSVEEQKKFSSEHDNILSDCDGIIVLGGDGTILETARAMGEREIPLIGINLGTLGFLSVIEKSRIDYAIKELFEENYTIENRMQLKITASSGGKISSCLALNDVTVTRSGLSRLIKTDVFINGQAVGSYSGDGCLVATPTGSTGYNLSAGGPIVTPEAKLMCVTPICPHTFNSRTIVVSGDDKVRIVIGEQKKSQDTESFATIDGQMAVRLNSGDYIDIEQADTVVKFIRFPEHSYFNVLNTKLNR